MIRGSAKYSLRLLEAALLSGSRLQTPGERSRAFLTINPAPKLLLVHPRQQSHLQVKEAMQLAETHAGEPCTPLAAGSARGFLRQPSTFFGSGTVEEVKSQCSLREFQRVFVNAELSGVQLRNLEAAWGRPVVDRVGLIIEIFAQRARTREARLQVELASLQVKASRLVRSVDAASGLRRGFGADGQTEIVSARERGRSGGMSGGLGGAAGGGETELQLQRRRIGTRIKALKRKLDEVRRTREVQRMGRQRTGKPVVAVVGYTSAGKSSLVSALSHRPVAARSRLFETLDPLLRRVYLPSGREALASDTVGFISELPHSLVSAFQATLEEVAAADLLLHVLDISSPNVAAQRATVYEVLRQLQIPEVKLQDSLIEVWNKSDLITDTDLASSFAGSGSEARDSLTSVASLHADTNILDNELRTGVSGGHMDAAAATGLRQQPNEAEEPRLGVSGIGEEADAEVDALDSEQGHAWRLHSNAEAAAQEETDSLRGAQHPLTKEEQRNSAWKLIQAIRRQQGGLQPRAIVTSAMTREGLPSLLQEIDCMVSVRCAIDDLKLGCARLGPRALSENVVGPAPRNPSLRKELPRRLPRVQPLKQEHARRLAIWQA